MKCKFCEKDILSKNFVRHLEMYHKEEKEVQKILDCPKGSKERRRAVILLRNSTNFDLYIRGIMRPRRFTNKNDAVYYPCIYCKGVFKKKYLPRHSKLCSNNKSIKTKMKFHSNYVTDSQTLAACAMDPTDMISRLNVTEQVFFLIIQRRGNSHLFRL